MIKDSNFGLGSILQYLYNNKTDAMPKMLICGNQSAMGNEVFDALKAINVLHSASIIHTDIKTDNWVLQATETDDVKLQLIDFGKAIDLKEICTSSKCTRVGMVGNTAVTDFDSVA